MQLEELLACLSQERLIEPHTVQKVLTFISENQC